MLLKDFYNITERNTLDENKFHWKIKINAQHEVFKGHFPGNPITPGVSMIQIIKEISEEILAKNLFLERVDNVKFMAIINPEKTPDLDLEITISEKDGKHKVKNISKFGDTVALKFSGTFKSN